MTAESDNVLLFHTDASGFGADDFLVRELRGLEEISRPYEFELVVECTIDGGLGPERIDALLDARAWVGFGPHGTRRAHGVVREVELIGMDDTAAWTSYRIALVPRFWHTTLTHRSRCWVDTSFPDILREVLEEAGWAEDRDWELRLDETYPDNADRQVVQYDESDFDFISRWLERLGIFYVFEQTDSAEKIVFIDVNANVPDVPEHSAVTYGLHADLGVAGSLQHLSHRARKRPAKLHVRDYEWRAAGKTHLVHGEHEVDAASGTGLVAHYGDHLGSDTDGAARAAVRAEEWMARKHVYAAESATYTFSAGHKFTLSGAPLGELDLDYLITRVEHEAAQDGRAAGLGRYRNNLEAIDYAAQFRPARRTRWPRIDGVINAKIDAASITSAAPLDDKGRYRVLLPYDLYGAFGAQPSRWIRKAEPYAGPAYGMHMSLHAGCEVLLAHVDGDPDWPIIVGAVPNDRMTTPLTKTHATRSAIRTRSGVFIDIEDDA